MTATITQARDDMLGVLKVAWEASADSQNLPMLYPDVAGDPPTEGAWGRATVLHTGSNQASLANHAGVRRFRRTGVVVVQLFTPPGGGQVLSDDLVTVVKNAFEGITTTNGVVFLNVTPRDIGQSGGFYQANVQADFEYDEVR